MAVPSLIQKAGLTLFHNPHLQPEGVSIDYSDLGKFASVIQRRQRQVSRRRGILSRAATRINALLRAFSVRCFVAGLQPSGLLHMYYWRPSYYWRQLNPDVLRGGRRYLGLRRDAFGLGPVNPNLRYP